MAVFSNKLTRAALSFTVEPADPPTAPIDVAPTVALNENALPGAFPDSKPKVRVKLEEDEATPRSLPSGNAEPLCTTISGLASARKLETSKWPLLSVCVQPAHSVGRGDGRDVGME